MLGGWRVEVRERPPLALRLATPLLAVVLTLASGSVMFLWLGYDLLDTFSTFFISPLADWNGISEWLLKASPLILIGCGLAVGFRANVWNIGAEGQLVIGAIAASGIGLFAPFNTSFWVLPLMIVAGMFAGMAWASLAALLRTRYNTNEILVTLMLSYVAVLILTYLVQGPWRDPDGFNYPQTALLPYEATLPLFDYAYRLNYSIFITIAVLLLIWWLNERSFLGYKMSVSGSAPRAARYGGFRENSAVWVGLLVSGACAGLAGAAEAAGPLGQLSAQISPGYGFAAIIVAFIGRLNVLGIVFAGLLLSLLYMGGEAAQIEHNLPAALTRVFQGTLLLFLLAADFLAHNRIVRVRA